MDLAVWRDVSLVWLILWTCLALLPIGAILFIVITGLHHLRPVTRKALRSVQSRAQQVAGATDRVSLKVATPAIELRARAAQVARLRGAVQRRRER